MNKFRLATLCATFASALISSSSFSQIVTTNAVDNAGNYSSGWGNGSNGGSGFQPWVLSSGNGTGGFGGNFIGISTNAGVTGISSNSFGLYANPTGSGAFANAERGFSNPLEIGQTLSFKWAINWDSGSGIFASKGVVLSAGASEIFNLNNGSSSAITLNGSNVNFGYGTAAMTWSFTRTAANSYRVVANGRDGSTTYSNSLTVTNGALDKIKFYAYNMQAGDAAQPYFNDLLITTTTADVTPPVINLATGVDKVTWVAKNGTINLGTNDVTATDNSGPLPVVTFLPATVNTATDGLTTVTYTATDPSGNTATVTRVIAVGDAEPNWRKLHFPQAVTINTNGTTIVYGRIYIDGATPDAGKAPNVTAELGVNSANTDPSTWTGSGVWSPATHNAGFTGGDDEYESPINGSALTPGAYYYAYRFKIGNGAWRYAGINAAGTDGGPWDGTTYGNGVLTVVPVRNVTFAVDMGVQIFKGLFDPSTNGVEVRGDFNGFAGSPLIRQGTSTVYTNTFAINGTNGTSVNYKFFGYGTNELAWEARGNRSLTLGSSNTNLPTVFFSDVSESRKITFKVNMGAQEAAGKFNFATDNVYVQGTFNGWTTNNQLADNGGSSTRSGIYEGTVTVDGSITGLGYKFFYGTNNYETSIPNRTITTVISNLTTATLPEVFFNNDDGKPPVITLNGSNAITINLQDAFTDPGATALDDIDGTVPVAINNTVNTALAGTYTNTYTASDAAGNSSTNTRTVVVSDGTGVDTRPVTFAVDMSVENFKGRFDPATNGVEVRGSFNNFSGSSLVRQGTSLIYTNTFPLVGSNGAVRTFKFFSTGTNAVGFESGADREVTMASNGVTVNTGTNFFNGVAESRKITFRVDMSAQALLGNFNTNTGVVKLAGTFNSWQAAPMVAQGNGIYALEVAFDGPLNVSGVEYKFLNGDTFETVSTPTGNRTLSGTFPNLQATPLDPVLFGDEQARSLTFKVDMGVQITKGLFAHTNPVEVRFGDFLAGGKTLTREGSTTIYSGTFPVAGNAGSPFEYKFWRTNAATNVTFERVDVPRTNDLANRTYTLGSNGVSATLSTAFFNNDDGIGPVITLRGANPLNLTNGAVFTDPGATAADAAEGTSVDITGTGTVDTSVANSYTVTYTATDANGNAATSVTRTVVVAPATPAPSGLSYTPSTLNGAVGTAIGNLVPTVTGTVTNWSVSPPLPTGLSIDASTGVISGTPTVVTASDTYTVTASNAGGSTTATVTIQVNDTTAPVITLIGSPTVTVDWAGSYTDAGATATDDVDNSVTVNSSGTVNTSVPGTYTITFTASDAAGNAAETRTRTVTVAKPSSTPGADGLSPLLRLAYGGTNSNSVVARPSLALSGSNLTLTAIVRTNQSNLTVVGQWVTNVNQFTNTNVVNSNTITGTASANQTNVPAGCERRVFSVPQNTDTRKFLRLKVEMP